MFSFFESLLNPTARPPHRTLPVLGEPRALVRFYVHFLRQAPWLIVGLFVSGIMVAGLDLTLPLFIGQITAMLTHTAPKQLLATHWRELLLMAVVVLLLRPGARLMQDLFTNQAINPGLTNLIRWQNHFHLVRQSWTFFQNDFAGRIANRVMQTGPALRESMVSATNAVWYFIVYGTAAILVLTHADWRLGLPILAWLLAYIGLMIYTVPRLRERSRAVSEARSALTGRIVDSYTNILTVKLFARSADEDAFVQETVDRHTKIFRRQTRMVTGWIFSLTTLNALMIAGTATVALALWVNGKIALAAVATALPMAWNMANFSGWISMNISAIFENLGVVQDGMRSIAQPRQMGDAPDATPFKFHQGRIEFDHVTFDYGRIRDQGARGGVLHDLSLTIEPGERVGLIGRSGAGKSTLVNLLLRFHDPATGRITIDGQNIKTLTQESLRGAIGMVTQDTSLLHRSIAENIRYGRPEASMQDVIDAAREAHAFDFIEELEDWDGRRGFDAHVGERGVKLSGGQRQRIAIARVILKDAPILVLDEATSALDSEVEAAIQEQLAGLMEGRTVIAIAHRLSTIARMDRLIILDAGRIVETGTHDSLLNQNGIYASLWRRQSGAMQIDA
ncbi:ABC transporter ATP-binding protein [Acidiphilium acidophilum]|uniref:ABC transporter ATP-binding protein n=1 Tax=Acidiphilium acidophilum TaxID=76588 RepID=A0AAW9DLM1_ACIAO|nr:ABC transporter ATP-binding protein [Acidiphilium acidophilum]MDX5929953.1 ABC transporter ATP-binding protein [Acidiphilium acidophilum]